ncbi:hypothetical protein RFH45_02045 [Acinetobacter baumannii]|nr:hypothetical protein [Acinetobacter baumannii]MDQ9874014.1 hypothetical protein [Acinetobacter baumannii]
MAAWQIFGIIVLSIFFVVMSYYYTWSALRGDDPIDENEVK